MQTNPELWWSLGVGTATLILGAVSYVLVMAASQRRFIKAQEDQLRQLRSLATRLQSAREEERIRIARELHDDLGQILTGVKMHLVVMKDSMRSSRSAEIGEVIRKMDSLTKLMDDCIHIVRNVASELRSFVLDDLGLVEAIEWEAEQFTKLTGTKCMVATDVEELDLSKQQAIAVLRIFQESLTNITRHANAAAVNVIVTRDQDSLLLEIRDDGCGMTEGEAKDSKALGILGMKERAVFLGGELSVTGTKGHGTKVSLKIPLSADVLSP